MKNTFEQFFYGITHGSKVIPGMHVAGPKSNGDCLIEYEGNIKIIISPNLMQKNGRVVMDFICVPLAKKFDITDSYNISAELEDCLPGKEYLYGESIIERSLSRTACIRFSLDQEILNDLPSLIRSIQFLSHNGNIILHNQLEYA